MSSKNSNVNSGDCCKHEVQTPSLSEMLRSIEIACKQFSLYGIDHPNSVEVVERLNSALEVFIEPYERVTCVFTEDAVIVNEHFFESSSESVQIFHRIRARGAMAITFVGLPPADQIREFILFLNMDPREVRLQGGPCSYLRKNGVTRIVLTESVYTVGDPYNEEDFEHGSQTPNMDIAVASAIHWLTTQDDKKEDVPNLPITQILSNPESAAKLIREAVTKLHASKRDNTSGEIACDVVNDMKSLASAKPQEWDKATGQIRKTIAKLPNEMQPSFSGFVMNEGESDGKQPVNVSEIEAMLRTLFQGGLKSDGETMPVEITDLFGTRAYGPLSSWQNELQPSSVMTSTGTTLITLIKWERSACEHGRIAAALSELVLRAVDIDDIECVLLFTRTLLDEIDNDTEEDWRRTNARSALASIDPVVLTKLIRSFIASESYDAKQAATALLELYPEFAPDMTDLLEQPITEEFRKVLTDAIIKSGSSASAGLSKLLHNGKAVGKMAALETLIESSRAWALEEVAGIINGSDQALALEAIRLLPKARIPLTGEILTNAVSHPDMEIRCAALEALGEFGDESKLDFLDAVARRRPFFGRAKYESIRRAAKRAADQIRQNHKAA